MRSGFVLAVALVLVLALGTLRTEGLAQGNEFTFTTVGDLGGTANTDRVLNGIGAAGAQFQLTLGDLSYGSYAPESAWCSYVSGKVGSTFPFELGAGNHDSDGTGQGHINNFVTCLPDRIGNLTGTYGKEYYFDYQSLARFIYISPNLTLDGQSYAYTVGSARYNWLASAIDSARAANLPWVVVAMHKNCISTGAKSCEIGSDLFNLLVGKKVDLVLQAHDHNYQRSKQLALTPSCPAIVPTVYDADCVHDGGGDRHYPKGGGTVLAIVGTGGANLYPSNHLDSEAGYFARFFHPLNDAPSHGFLQVKVSATALRAQFVATDTGATFSDSFTVSRSPLIPTLASFIAQLNPRGRVRVKWTTANETNVEGFNVWRSHYKKTGWEKITLEPLAAKYPNTTQGARYRLTDRDITTNSKYFYKLEILHTDHTVEWSAPIKVKIP